MTTHVKLNSLNEMEKGLKCEACRAYCYIAFCREFNKSNNIGA